MLLPKPGPLPQTSHVAATEFSFGFAEHCLISWGEGGAPHPGVFDSRRPPRIAHPRAPARTGALQASRLALPWGFRTSGCGKRPVWPRSWPTGP